MTNTAATRKTIPQLGPADFQEFPIWTFEGSGDEDLLLRPVTKWPVADLGGSVAGSEVTLSNGSKAFAMFSNVFPDDPRSTRHLLTLSVAMPTGKWFNLARYFEPTVRIFGPNHLAQALGLPVEAVFPISYDLRPLIVGQEEALHGRILAEPQERLTLQEVRNLRRRRR
jgi:hypothetical protein